MSSPVRPGEMFDRYRVEALVGEGGMALVYRAMDTIQHRRVALKIVRPELAFEPNGSLSEATLRLLREGKAASKVRHPNAVELFEVGECQGIPFIAMEFVSGRPLSELVGDPSVPLMLRIEWLLGIALGLAEVHARGILHRDVKPENVMITSDREAKVMDFGIAKSLHAAEAERASLDPEMFVTSAGSVLGTPMYMAPEQAIGDTMDGRTDQFAWGTMAYELLANGIHPVKTSNPRNLTVPFVIVQERPLPLREVAPHVPEEVAAMVMRAIEKNPEDRYPDMGQLGAQLEAYLRRQSDSRYYKPPAVPSRETTGRLPIVEHGRPRDFVPTVRSWFWLLAFALLAGIVSFSVLWMMRKR